MILFLPEDYQSSQRKHRKIGLLSYEKGRRFRNNKDFLL